VRAARPHSSARNVRRLYGYWFLRDFQIWIPVWIVFLTLDQGFSLTQVTIAESAYLVGVVLLEVPTGAVADRWGRSRSMALGALAMGAAVLMFAFTTSFPILLADFLLWSLATSLMSGSDMALLFDSLKADQRESLYERVAGRGNAFIWLGAGIATFLGGPVAAVLETRATIFIGAATCLLTALVALSMTEPPHQRAAKRQSYISTIPSAFREAWALADVRRVILLAGTTIAVIEGSAYLVQPYLLDRGIEVGPMFSLLQVPVILAGIVGALAAATIVSRRGAIFAVTVLPVVGVGGYFALVAGPGLSTFFAFPLMFATISCLLPAASGYVNRRVASERRATILSFQGMVASLTGAVTVPVLGYVTDGWGLSWAFATGGTLTLVVMLFFGLPLLLGKRPEPPSLLAVEPAAPES
jgi:MFS family permease